MASSTAATMGSLFSFNGCTLECVWKETSLIVVLGRQQICGLMAATATMGSLFSFYSLKSKKHTKFLVCFFVLKLNYWSEIFEFNVVPQCVMVRCDVSNTRVLS